MTVCKNCGAAIEEKETRCPFCNALQYDAAQEEYMENLYHVNDTMGQLDDRANKKMKNQLLIMSGAAILLIALAVLAGASSGYKEYKERVLITKQEMAELTDWYEENIDMLESALIQGEYAKVDKMVWDSGQRNHLPDIWDGYCVWSLYNRTISSLMSEREYFGRYEKTEREYEYKRLYEDAIEFLAHGSGLSDNRDFARAEGTYPEIIAEWTQLCEEILEEDLQISKEEYTKDMKELYVTKYADGNEVDARALAYYERYLK